MLDLIYTLDVNVVDYLKAEVPLGKSEHVVIRLDYYHQCSQISVPCTTEEFLEG